MFQHLPQSTNLGVVCHETGLKRHMFILEWVMSHSLIKCFEYITKRKPKKTAYTRFDKKIVISKTNKKYTIFVKD